MRLGQTSNGIRQPSLLPTAPVNGSGSGGIAGNVSSGGSTSSKGSRRNQHLQMGRPTQPSRSDAHLGRPGSMPERSVVGNGLIGPPGVPSPVGARDPQRINPVGGVIGRTQPDAPLVGGPGISRVPSPESSTPSRQRDPDEFWQVNEGVPAVVVPPAPATGFDPGPAIGVDR